MRTYLLVVLLAIATVALARIPVSESTSGVAGVVDRSSMGKDLSSHESHHSYVLMQLSFLMKI